jgi:mannitol/fructose-specific phosphotransferase system IIA component
MEMLTQSTIQLAAHAPDKSTAIKQAGELLADAGYVAPEYIEGMLAREEIMTTYLGNGVAIPHGQYENRGLIHYTGISVVQLPDGVEWSDGEAVHLVIGIAAIDNEHINILANIAEVIEEPALVEVLATTSDPQEIIDCLTSQQDI